MSALTERYVWAVLRAVPASQRAELEPEIRALVGDAVEARNGDPTLDDAAAERAALTELGDPPALAARYAGTPQYLIGPRFFPEWRRLLTLLLPIIVPIVGVVVTGANLLGGASVGSALAAGIGTAINVAIQTLFWFTLVFAVIERVADGQGEPKRAWSVDDLPELPDDGRISVGDAISSIIANVIVAGAILWVMLRPPIVIDGTAYPLFDPALWSFWLPYFLAAPLVIARSDLVLTAPRRLAELFAASHDLVLVDPPLDLEGFAVVQIWHARVADDPALRWLRATLVRAAAGAAPTPRGARRAP